VRFLVSGSIEEHPRYIESEFPLSTRPPPLAVAINNGTEREREREREGEKEAEG